MLYGKTFLSHCVQKSSVHCVSGTDKQKSQWGMCGQSDTMLWFWDGWPPVQTIGCCLHQKSYRLHGCYDNRALSIWRWPIFHLKGGWTAERKKQCLWAEKREIVDLGCFVNACPCALLWTNELMTGSLSFTDKSFKNRLAWMCAPTLPQKDTCHIFT